VWGRSSIAPPRAETNQSGYVRTLRIALQLIPPPNPHAGSRLPALHPAM